MSPTVQISLALLAFFVPAFFATRLRLSGGRTGGTQTVSSYALLSQLKTEAARSYVNRLLLKMGWAWVLLCAPLIAYKPEIWIDLRMYSIALLGCLLLGIILSGISYSQIENFKSIDIDTESAEARAADKLLQAVKYGEIQGEDVEKAYTAMRVAAHTEAQKAAMEKALGPLRRNNSIMLLYVFLTTAAVFLVSLLAVWSAGMSTLGFWILIGILGLVVLLAYFIATIRFW